MSKNWKVLDQSVLKNLMIISSVNDYENEKITSWEMNKYWRDIIRRSIERSRSFWSDGNEYRDMSFDNVEQKWITIWRRCVRYFSHCSFVAKAIHMCIIVLIKRMDLRERASRVSVKSMVSRSNVRMDSPDENIFFWPKIFNVCFHHHHHHHRQIEFSQNGCICKRVLSKFESISEKMNMYMSIDRESERNGRSCSYANDISHDTGCCFFRSSS